MSVRPPTCLSLTSRPTHLYRPHSNHPPHFFHVRSPCAPAVASLTCKRPEICRGGGGGGGCCCCSDAAAAAAAALMLLLLLIPLLLLLLLLFHSDEITTRLIQMTPLERKLSESFAKIIRRPPGTQGLHQSTRSPTVITRKVSAVSPPH